MKRIFTLFGALLLTKAMFAQGPTDALRIAKNSYEGTARTMAMGNAFTALGGDMGAIAINPAASAVYRSFEMGLSIGYTDAAMNSSCLGTSYKGNKGQLTLPSIGVVGSYDTGNISGLFNLTFGFVSNRINSFTEYSTSFCSTDQATMLGSLAAAVAGVDKSKLAITDTFNPYTQTSNPWSSILAYEVYGINEIDGTTDSYIATTENIDGSGNITVGGKLDQFYGCKTNGGVQEFSLNIGGNVSDVFYFGANINIHSVDYDLDEFYSETPVNVSQFQDGIKNFKSDYWQRTTGSGINLKLGCILTPFAGLRLGATFQTPTLYSLNDTWGRYMYTEYDSGNWYEADTPHGSYDYQLKTPARWSVGAAYTLFDRALLSADFESVNYSKTKLASEYGNEGEFMNENRQMNMGLMRSDIYRFGAEIWATDRIAARGGYNIYTSAGRLISLEDNSTIYTYPASRYFSCGAGFKMGSEGNFTLDVAYQHMLPRYDKFTVFSDYDVFQAPEITGNHTSDTFVVSLAFKF